MEDRHAKLDERKVGAGRWSGRKGFLARSGLFLSSSHTVAAGFLAGLLACSAAAAQTQAQPAPVRGKLVLKGKALSFSRAWLVRGPDTSDEARPAAYLILSSKDLSQAIQACADIRCVLDAVKDGAVLEPLDDGRESFWLRVVSPQLSREEQLSGRRWIPAIDSHEQLSGKLEFSYTNTSDEADLSIDALLLKEFPVRVRR